MKTLVCEMCGSNNLLKEEGVFVCQNCKTKYTVEEAKRMMIDGTVDVTGTVKVDNTDTVTKYLQNARRAKAKEDWEETEKYYNLVEQNDPDNIEAIFYSSYGKAKRSLIEDDIYKRQQVFKTFNNCISLLDDKFDAKNAESEKESLEAITKDMMRLLASEFVFTQTKNLNGVVTGSNKGMTHDLFKISAAAFVATLYDISKKAPEKYIYKLLIEFIEYYNALPLGSTKPFKNIYYEALEALGEIDGEDVFYKKKVLEEKLKDLKIKKGSLELKLHSGCGPAGTIFSVIFALGLIIVGWILNRINGTDMSIFVTVAGIDFAAMMLITLLVVLIGKAKAKKIGAKEKLAEVEAEIAKVEEELAKLN